MFICANLPDIIVFAFGFCLSVLKSELNFSDIPLSAERVCPAYDDNNVNEKRDLWDGIIFVRVEFLDDEYSGTYYRDDELLFKVEWEKHEVHGDFLAEVIADFILGNQEGKNAAPVRH